MFTGIIHHTGKIVKKDANTLQVSVGKPLPRLSLGASIAVNGTCLTVAKILKPDTFSADIMPETWKRTMLSSLEAGDAVNVEFPLRPTDGYDGHFVQGHVDGIAKLASITPSGQSRLLKFAAGSDIAKHLVEKGSIAVNGVSLTIIEADKKGFTVGIIPHTWEQTNLKHLAVGDAVNIETDILMKKQTMKIQNKKISHGGKPKIAIIAATYRAEIAENLIGSCVAELEANGLGEKDISVFRVPGALEIPLTAKKLAKQGKYDAIVVFGVVVKGDTYHFEQVADECARGCMNVSYEFEIPVVFQVLCVYKLADALVRSRGTKDNRGTEGAKTALAMTSLFSDM